MRGLIPDVIRARIEAFAATGKTGQVVLNIYLGHVVSADIREHIKASQRKDLLDKTLQSD